MAEKEETDWTCVKQDGASENEGSDGDKDMKDAGEEEASPKDEDDIVYDAEYCLRATEKTAAKCAEGFVKTAVKVAADVAADGYTTVHIPGDDEVNKANFVNHKLQTSAVKDKVRALLEARGFHDVTYTGVEGSDVGVCDVEFSWDTPSPKPPQVKERLPPPYLAQYTMPYELIGGIAKRSYDYVDGLGCSVIDERRIYLKDARGCGQKFDVVGQLVYYCKDIAIILQHKVDKPVIYNASLLSITYSDALVLVGDEEPNYFSLVTPKGEHKCALKLREYAPAKVMGMSGYPTDFVVSPFVGTSDALLCIRAKIGLATRSARFDDKDMAKFGREFFEWFPTLK